MVKVWGPRALAALQLGLLAALVAYRDAGLRTIPEGDGFVGACSLADAQLAGMLWVALVAVGLVGCVVALFSRAKWLGMAIFLGPVVAATTLSQYQHTHYPACWDEHGAPASGSQPAVPMK